ncbi:Ureidoglycolate lyase [Drechslerella dactyloides]|uniref:Ureidoglycolate lyase n=1 Tax=Drechslerella dactyloides TaxID=74499 RepID=A0AAD6NJS0_DREDA|nr:Ureidoglycolate lyase [Drechslerella dactyloides]
MPEYTSTPAATISIPLAPLTPASFAPFGTVIEKPRPKSDSTTTSTTTTPPTATVNQGTAAKYPSISPFVSYAPPSGNPSTGRMNLFVCNPRVLGDGGRTFTVGILERHPYTTQTFIPIGLDGADDSRRYLVIVAPTLADKPVAPSTASTTVTSTGAGGLVRRLWQQRPPAFPLKNRLRTALSNPANRPPVYPVQEKGGDEVEEKDVSGTVVQKGRGLPDLSGIRAFICRGDQAVTYGVGTWHAPMVVLGDGPVEFVVVMHENGVAVEDCEECEIVGGRVKVVIDGDVDARVDLKARL